MSEFNDWLARGSLVVILLGAISVLLLVALGAFIFSLFQ